MPRTSARSSCEALSIPKSESRRTNNATLFGISLPLNEHSHSDLFWGLRGGGGNFRHCHLARVRVVTVREVLGGFVAYPLAQGKDVLTAYAE
jgi:hypothetical protein